MWKPAWSSTIQHYLQRNGEKQWRALSNGDQWFFPHELKALINCQRHSRWHGAQSRDPMLKPTVFLQYLELWPSFVLLPARREWQQLGFRVQLTRTEVDRGSLQADSLFNRKSGALCWSSSHLVPRRRNWIRVWLLLDPATGPGTERIDSHQHCSVATSVRRGDSLELQLRALHC
jgi:hypothetical protein